MELFKLLGTIAIENDSANNAIDETTDKASNSSNTIIDSFKKIGAAVATYFAADKIIAFGKEIVNTSATVQAEEAAFAQIMGTYSDEASEKINKIADATGIVASRLTPYMTSMTAKFKGLGYDVDEATDLASTGLNIAADAAAFWDKSMEDSMSALNSFVNGNYEGGEAIGLFANETTLATWASENLNLEWKELTEKEKQFARLQFAKSMQEASGATGQAANESGAYANVQANLNEKWRQFKAQIGEPLLEKVVIPAMKWLGDFITNTLVPAYGNLKIKLQEAKNWFVENEDKINAVANAVGILAAAFVGLKVGLIIQKITQGFQTARVALSLFSLQTNGASIAQGFLNGQLTLGQVVVGLLTGKISLATLATNLWKSAQTKLNAVITANPIGVVVMAIAALIAILVVAYNKSDTFRAVCDKLFAKLKDLWAVILKELEPVFQQLIGIFNELWKIVEEDIIPIFQEIMVAISDLWTQVKPIIDSIMPIVKKVVEVLVQLISTSFKNIIQVITVALNTIKNVIKLVTSLIKGDWSGAWDAIKNIFSGIWTGIKNMASNVGNTMKNILGKHWDTIKDKTSKTWNKIKDAIMKPINAAKDAVKKVVDAIKGFFDNLKLKIPKIKTPHFKLKNASLNPKDWIEKGVPKLSIEWYKEGAVLNKPTAFGINPSTNSIMAGGEAGKEAIAPIDTLMGYVKDAVASETSGMNETLYLILDLLNSLLPQLINLSSKRIVLNNGVLVGELAPEIDVKLGNIYEGRGRGR